jgi:phosphoglycolate phosphatase
MMRTSTRLILLDLDNTLYDWVACFVPSMIAVVNTVRDAVEADLDRLLDEFRSVYVTHRSVEYAFCVQALPSVAHLSKASQQALVDRARAAFRAAREAHLVAYPGVPETLRDLSEAGIALIATTNAPMHQAMRRLETLGISTAFTAVAARRSFEVPSDGCLPAAVAARKRAAYMHPARFWHFDNAHLKPSDHMYRAALTATGLHPREVLVVGDSLVNDVAPALRLGARGAWARYGLRFDARLWETLLAVTPWSAAVIDAHHGTGGLDAPALDAFGEIRALI